MKTITERLTELAQHMETGILSPAQASHWLRAEIEAVGKLQKEEKAARECLQLITNHHLNGVAIHDRARNVVEARMACPVDGNTELTDAKRSVE